jgi:hypothetical protein
MKTAFVCRMCRAPMPPTLLFTRPPSEGFLGTQTTCACGCSTFEGPVQQPDPMEIELEALRKRVRNQRQELKRINRQMRLYLHGLDAGVRHAVLKLG